MPFPQLKGTAILVSSAGVMIAHAHVVIVLHAQAWEDVGAWERLSGNVPPACLAPGPQEAALVRQRYVKAAMARQLQTQSAAQAFRHAATPNH